MTTERTYKRSNRFNGESIMLTKEEAKRHDELFMRHIPSNRGTKTFFKFTIFYLSN